MLEAEVMRRPSTTSASMSACEPRLIAATGLAALKNSRTNSAGPIMAALTGAAVGGTVGGVTGALIGLGIPEYEAKRYEGKLKGGHCLVSVHSENSHETEKAKKIFEAASAEDISTSTEPSEITNR